MTLLKPAGTPLTWKLAIIAAMALCVTAAYTLQGAVGTRGQALLGLPVFLGLAALASTNLRAVSRKTLLWGMVFQLVLALAVIKVGYVREVFEVVGSGIKVLIKCSDEGAKFVFGPLVGPTFPPNDGVSAVGGGPAGYLFQEHNAGRPFSFGTPFIFAFKALPPIIFVSSFFSVLYYFGVLQFFVRLFARMMMYLMGTSGAETLSVAANVFMGQTEAPLIVKPFVPKMTRSELLALMASGMAHISGGMMAVYISYGADPVAILCTCVMACPCSLYLTKLVLPELETPETLGTAPINVEKVHSNAIDAAASGVKDGLFLALNVAAMLIAFLAFIALFDSILGGIKPLLISAGIPAEQLEWWRDDLRLEIIFGKLFSPVAYLMGIDSAETDKVGSLLGIKLAANEHVAYLKFKDMNAAKELSERSMQIAVYALSGFANFASIGIQLGGIGAMAPERRADLARLGMKALFVGFLATVINATVAGLLMNS